MLRSIVEAETLEQFFWVGGRIDRLYKSDFGHIYFELVDERNRIKCILRDERTGHIPFDLSNHLDVEVYGDVHFFETRAEAQINVSDIRRVGKLIDETNVIGQLRAEGLFPPQKKSPPIQIRRIGIVTSRSSRAIGDFETAYQSAGERAVLAPVSWQYVILEGDRAAQSIADGIASLSTNPEIDVIAIIRGGGRSENLGVFDDAEILRAIINCTKFVTTGIGHHRDRALADEVADYVASTPTAAATYLADLCLRQRLSPAKSQRYGLIVSILAILAVGSLILLAFTLVRTM